MTWPAIIFWALCFGGLFSRRPILIYLLFISAAFGALAMLPPQAVGVTILPQPVCIVFLALWSLRWRGNGADMAAAAIDLRKLGFLFFFIVYAGIGAYIMPRLFAGKVDVLQMRAAAMGPLAPSTSNFAQSFYLIVSFTAGLACFTLVRSPANRRHFLQALVIGGATLIFTGLVDMAAAGTSLLAPFKNASYSMILDAEMASVRRVVGLMPEASSYGGACISFAAAIYFTRWGLEPGFFRRVLSPLVTLGLLGMTALSTSTTAYLGLVLFFGLAGLFWIVTAIRARGRLPRREFVGDVGFIFAGLIVVVSTFALQPQLLQLVSDLVDSVVLKKTMSDSYIERSSWTQAGIANFFETHGMGVGVGSNRTSNWAIAVLSGTGAIGSALMALYLLQTMLRNAADPLPEISRLLRGLKFTCMLILFTMCAAGTTPDFGSMIGILSAFAAYLATRGDEAPEPKVVFSPRGA